MRSINLPHVYSNRRIGQTKNAEFISNEIFLIKIKSYLYAMRGEERVTFMGDNSACTR